MPNHGPASYTGGYFGAVVANFMGNSPTWYKTTVLALLVLNPFIYYAAGPYITGWVILAEFVGTLALSLVCHPLTAGGLIALESVFIGLATPKAIYDETHHNFPVILLLMFMVAGIYFMKDFLAFIFTKLLFSTNNKTTISLLFCSAAALLSAWLDALTVIAVIIAVATAFHSVYESADIALRVPQAIDDAEREEYAQMDMDEFRGFLRNLMMHGAVGTALGGVCTIVGEPQNLMIGAAMGWNFTEFFVKMMPVTIPVFFVGIATCFVLEKFKLFGYGTPLPERVRAVLKRHEEQLSAKRDTAEIARLAAQCAGMIWLVLALALHLAEVGLIGLSVIIILTSFTGKTGEHDIGLAFVEALPFTGLLVVFFGVVAVIHENDLFRPVIDWALARSGTGQIMAFFGASGILSAISDNVFVATIYITEAKNAFDAGVLTREQFEALAVAINTGTNIASIFTPNGQAAFLFLLTSSIAAMIGLSYARMLLLALPYAVTTNVTAALLVPLVL